jgi:Tol biopolymer transport system component
MSNIYRVDMTDVGDLTPIDEGELVNLTNNPEGDIPDNKVISTFTLSPDGKRILFSATPNLGQNYRPFTGTNDARPMSDTELYKMSVCGGEAEQITNDVAYAAFRPRTLPIPDASACGKVPLPVVE